jgi:hypothetical protein
MGTFFNYTVLTSHLRKFLKLVSLKQVFHASLCLECLQWQTEGGSGGDSSAVYLQLALKDILASHKLAEKVCGSICATHLCGRAQSECDNSLGYELEQELLDGELFWWNITKHFFGLRKSFTLHSHKPCLIADVVILWGNVFMHQCSITCCQQTRQSCTLK